MSLFIHPTTLNGISYLSMLYSTSAVISKYFSMVTFSFILFIDRLNSLEDKALLVIGIQFMPVRKDCMSVAKVSRLMMFNNITILRTK